MYTKINIKHTNCAQKGEKKFRLETVIIVIIINLHMTVSMDYE